MRRRSRSSGSIDDRATRAALRFFKERRLAIHFVDLRRKPIAPGELRRFIDRLGAAAAARHRGPSLSATAVSATSGWTTREIVERLPGRPAAAPPAARPPRRTTSPPVRPRRPGRPGSPRPARTGRPDGIPTSPAGCMARSSRWHPTSVSERTPRPAPARHRSGRVTIKSQTGSPLGPRPDGHRGREAPRAGRPRPAVPRRPTRGGRCGSCPSSSRASTRWPRSGRRSRSSARRASAERTRRLRAGPRRSAGGSPRRATRSSPAAGPGVDGGRQPRLPARAAACRSAATSSCRTSRASTPYVDLGVEFRYFFARKTMFVKYADGVRDPARRLRDARRAVRGADADPDRQGPPLPGRPGRAAPTGRACSTGCASTLLADGDDRRGGPRPAARDRRPRRGRRDHPRASRRPARRATRPSVRRARAQPGSATSIQPSTTRTRVVAEAADPGQPARLGLLAGRVDLRRRGRPATRSGGRRRPGRGRRSSASGRRRRCTGRTGPRGAGRRRRSRRARRSTAARSCAGSGRRWRRSRPACGPAGRRARRGVTRRIAPGGSSSRSRTGSKAAVRAPGAAERAGVTPVGAIVHRAECVPEDMETAPVGSTGAVAAEEEVEGGQSPIGRLVATVSGRRGAADPA